MAFEDEDQSDKNSLETERKLVFNGLLLQKAIDFAIESRRLDLGSWFREKADAYEERKTIGNVAEVCFW